MPIQDFYQNTMLSYLYFTRTKYKQDGRKLNRQGKYETNSVQMEQKLYLYWTDIPDWAHDLHENYALPKPQELKTLFAFRN